MGIITPPSIIRPFPVDDASIAGRSKEISFEVKLTKQERRKIKMFFKHICKIPRKLKKAAKHIEIYMPDEPIIKTMNDGKTMGYFSYYSYRIEQGYPCTKWVKKALSIYIGNAQSTIKRLFDKYNN